MLAMVSCGKSELTGETIDDKSMTITASRADTGDFFATGSLVFEEGEQLSIEPNLESGEMTIEFISAEGMDNPDELPEHTVLREGEIQEIVERRLGIEERFSILDRRTRELFFRRYIRPESSRDMPFMTFNLPFMTLTCQGTDDML